MRLIDADELEELFREVIGDIAKKPEINGAMEHMVRASAMTIEMIHDAPTIEPQPEPEDWEWCHDCKEYDHELHCCHRWNKVIKETVEELKQAQPEQQWIPVTERLPEYDKPVLLSTAWGKTEIGFWTQRGWMIVACSYREFEQGAVAAWMPLPEPYRRCGEDE